MVTERAPSTLQREGEVPDGLSPKEGEAVVESSSEIPVERVLEAT